MGADHYQIAIDRLRLRWNLGLGASGHKVTVGLSDTEIFAKLVQLLFGLIQYFLLIAEKSIGISPP